ncbi:MAG TPA: class I SAM-dependent methyltransferase [bacterium]|nr:class I SAM-dependent methyltransferase [bacterium]
MTVSSEPVQCRICGAEHRIHKTNFIQLYSQFQRPYYPIHWWFCEACRGLFAYPIPDESIIIAHWKTINYNRAEDVPGLHEARMALLRLALEELRRRNCHGTLLDVGSNYGYFLQEAEKDGWICNGFDPCDDGVSRTRDLGFQTYHGWELDSQSIAPDTYDAVTSFDAFCYVWHPRETLKAIRRILKPGGILMMRLTNKRHVIQWTGRLRTPGDALNMKMTTLLQNQFHSIAINDLKTVLRDMGFGDFRIYRRAATAPWHVMNRRSKTAYLGAEFLYYLTAGRLNISPGVLISAALKSKNGHA